ncbi:glycosyltransferase [Halopseudomonas nanhaiensis]|uniref:glycosyltransferase family 2 protein n=1 Tax=Halopseudomonas nanhaiensis TaxID=2830842 RepID=UPI001CBEF56F|nr:glycosyltransferase family 2 protein [Halopseudomonas nanhaiensis]UAW99450.1 glycosyltransferase [Halopseudomonas nanhaiensis]
MNESSPAPTLSIITICYNNRLGLERTFDSVRTQVSRNFEYIVVDGGSTDGSKQLIADNTDLITAHKSEPDRGIADAFNKGIALSTGSFLLFLNSGDVLADNETIMHLNSALSQDIDILVGDIEIGGSKYSYRKDLHWQILRNYLPHQAMCIGKELFISYGLYDQSYRLGMDYEWSLRLNPRLTRVARTPRVLSVMEPGGISTSCYKGTFWAYHAARQKNGTCPRSISAFITMLFIAKRYCGLSFRRLLRN